jgi:hypothetical protein
MASSSLAGRLIAAVAFVLFDACLGGPLKLPSTGADRISNAGGDKTTPIVNDLSGVWEGMSITSCNGVQFAARCDAVVDVTLTILQDGSTVSGFYRCAPNTVTCYHANESGVIKSGVFSGGHLSFRVMMDDGESCIFQSRPTAQRMLGAFLCLQGSALIERGQWRLERSY